MDTHTHLNRIRESRGISVAALAKLAGVTRQTVYAIEAGDYVPNTTVALQLARVLEVRVEELFSLDATTPTAQPVPAEFLTPARAGQPVQVCRVGKKTVAVSAPSDLILPPADGVVTDAGHVEMLPGDQEHPKRLLIAGCDPGISLLAPQLDFAAASASSGQALEWLKQGRVHVAGTHLRDAASDEYNLGAIRKLFPQGSVTVVTFAIWEQGLVMRPGTAVREIADLARVRIVNREAGAGSRALLDRRLKAAGMTGAKIAGYDRIVSGHLPAALAVRDGEADCCVATRSAARAFGLDFVPLAVERYDLVVRRAFAKLPSVEALFDLLNRSALRRKLEMLAGYDTSKTGAVLAA
jgi:molybdate-binding protein/DNA-binding XRE family transcriptional regulator